MAGSELSCSSCFAIRAWRRAGVFVLVGLALLFAAGPRFSVAAAAYPAYTVGSGWTPFTWSSAGSPLDDQGAFTFTLVGFGRLRVTDSQCRGDAIIINDGATAIFATNGVFIATPCPDPTGTSNPDAAFADVSY